MAAFCSHNSPGLRPLELGCQDSPSITTLYDEVLDELCQQRVPDRADVQCNRYSEDLELFSESLEYDCSSGCKLTSRTEPHFGQFLANAQFSPEDASSFLACLTWRSYTTLSGQPLLVSSEAIRCKSNKVNIPISFELCTGSKRHFCVLERLPAVSFRQSPFSSF